MPLIGYKCTCGRSENRMVDPRKVGHLASREKCPDCGNDTLKRQLGKTNSVSKITVDNGAQGKAVEIVPEVIDSVYKKNQS